MSEFEPEEGARKELTLDPENWESFRSLAHQMVDDTIDHLSALRDQPVWQPVPPLISNRILDEPMPWQGQGEETVYGEFVTDVLPYPNGNLHPRFFGWVQGNGVPFANLADMLASAMNPHLAGYKQAPALVESKIIAWMAELMGFPAESSGVLESGGTMANILALAIARHAQCGFDVRKRGLQAGQMPLTVYCSSETHGWIEKGVELLGIGTDWLRKIPVDDQFRMDLGALDIQLAKDRVQGFMPICVVATAGTVNTGAIDDLNGIADFCSREKIWFHVDGAFGAFARISTKFAPLVLGMERADSLSIDLHKWMYLPFEIACTLVRDQKAHVSTFAFAPSYIAGLERGVIAGGLPFSDRGIDLTRGFKALKAWMCLKAYGVEKFAQLIEQNIAQTQYLAQRIESEPNLELLSPTSLNVACFRYRTDGFSNEKLDAVNLEILLRVQESGVAVPSSTKINGVFAIRFCNVNHRSRQEDIDLLLDEVIRQADIVQKRH